MSSSHSPSSGSVRSPGRLTAIPSAIVSAESAATGSPRRSDSGYGAHAATCTPTTSTSGRADFTAIATPAASPPPPTGMTTRARSGTCSSSSSPSDPWPATMSGSSNGCTKAAPATRARWPARRRCTRRPSRRRCARSRRGCGPPPPWRSARRRGTKTSQRTPRAAAATASDWAWLPADAATTPRAQPSSPSAASLADAPRTLNEPVRWRFSALSSTTPPARSEIVRVERTGVRFATRSTSRASSRPRRVSQGRRGWHRSRRRRRVGATATPIVVRAGGASPK